MITGHLVRRTLAPIAAAQSPASEPKPSIDIYGAAMLDMGYQVEQNNPDWFDVVRPTRLPAFGGEFRWGRRENNSDGWTTNDYRVQFSFKYSFSYKAGGQS
jgi:hypothetical protein